MANHYEVLGVNSRAEAEDIHRAYLELARALHPDRILGASAEEAERAARRMQEANDAWRVLRDPGSRAAYDRALAIRHGRRPTRASDRPEVPPRHAAAPGSEPDDLDAPFRSAPAEPGDVGVSVVRALPWMAVLLILGAIFVFTAFAGGGGDADDPQELVGRCVSSGPATAIVAVPCEGPNDGEVVLVASRASHCPAASSSIPMAEGFLCVEPHNEIPPFASTTPQ